MGDRHSTVYGRVKKKNKTWFYAQAVKEGYESFSLYLDKLIEKMRDKDERRKTNRKTK